MAGARATLLCCVLLAAGEGLYLCCGIKLLKGLKGQSLFFPALPPVSADIARVTWRFQGIHIAEAKPRKKTFTVNYLPNFYGRLSIHPTNLSLEIRPLKVRDSGMYNVVVDTVSDPTNPKTFSYLLLVCGGSPEMAAGTGDAGGHSTVGPWGETKLCPGDATMQDVDGEQPPDSGGGPETCRVHNRYCVVKGYLVATIFGPLLLLVATVHIVTRDKATKPGDEGSAVPKVGSEPPSTTALQGPSPWQP